MKKNTLLLWASILFSSLSLALICVVLDQCFPPKPTTLPKSTHQCMQLTPERFYCWETNAKQETQHHVAHLDLYGVKPVVERQ